MIQKYDTEQGYCRKLGHHLNFAYCRTEHSGNPCPLIFDCWFERLPIGEFMREHYNAEDLPYLSMEKPQKMDTLFHLIQKAQSRSSESE